MLPEQVNTGVVADTEAVSVDGVGHVVGVGVFRLVGSGVVVDARVGVVRPVTVVEMVAARVVAVMPVM